jgi:ParB-like chromosome segregation protein Spo0J
LTSSSSLLSNAEEQQEHKKLLNELISNKGLDLPIIVNRGNVILDGHDRLKICQELRTEPQFKVKEFQDLSLIPINYIPFL